MGPRLHHPATWPPWGEFTQPRAHSVPEYCSSHVCSARDALWKRQRSFGDDRSRGNPAELYELSRHKLGYIGHTSPQFWVERGKQQVFAMAHLTLLNYTYSRTDRADRAGADFASNHRAKRKVSWRIEILRWHLMLRPLASIVPAEHA